MMEIHSLLLMGLAELLLVTTVVSVVLLFSIFSKKNKDRSAARTLIQRIKDDETRRLEETRKIMEGQYGFEDEDLKEIVAKINREEKVFYQNLINIYLKRDSESLTNLNVDFEGAVETYRTLELPNRSGTHEDEEGAASSEEIEALQQEIADLKEELQITMNTMGNMLAEYSAIFSGDQEAAHDPEKLAAIDNSDVEAMVESSESDAADPAGDADLMSLDEDDSGDGDLMSLDEDDSGDDDLMSLDEDDSGDDDLMSLDEDESGDDDLMNLDASDSDESDLANLDPEAIEEGASAEPGVAEGEAAEPAELDIDSIMAEAGGQPEAEAPATAATDESEDLENLDITSLEDMDDDLGDIPDTVDLDTQSVGSDDETVVLSQDSQGGDEVVDDPDALLDQIRSEDEKSKG